MPNIVLLVLCCTMEIAELLGCPEVELLNGKATILPFRYRTGVEYECNNNFKLVGTKVAFCRTGAWTSEVPFCVATTCRMPETAPGVVVKKLHSGGILSFTCRPGLVRVGAQRIKCLGEDWNKQPPVCAPIMSMNCDFEHEDLCGWSQDSEDEFDWIWHQGSTPTPNSGPLNDHTFNSSSGHYLFIESSSPMKFGDRARLLSPAYSRGTVDGMCLQFYYHMFGADNTEEVGNLDVYIFARSANASNDTMELLFHREGNQGDDWTVAEVYIPLRDTTIQVAFEATRLDGYFGDIAIDDVKIHNCTQGPELMVFTDMRADNNTPREIATEKTLPLNVSLSSREGWDVTSSATHRNDTFIDAEGMTAVMKVSTTQSHTRVMSSSNTQMDINILSQTIPPSDTTQTFVTLPNHSTLKEANKDPDILSHNGNSATISILYNDFVKDHQNEISDNQEGHTFVMKHAIIVNIFILTVAAVVATFRLVVTWLKHRRRIRLNQRQVGYKTGGLATASSAKWAEAYV